MVRNFRAHCAALCVLSLATFAHCSYSDITAHPHSTSPRPLEKENPVAACAPTVTSLRAKPSPHLRHLTIGTAYRSSFAFDDPCYREIALSAFDSLTTEIGTMTNTLYPNPGIFDFTEADAVADVAKKNSLDFQIHALIWDPLDQPGWKIVPEHLRRLSDHDRHHEMLHIVTTAMKRYVGISSAATVINEPFDQRGKLQHSLWWRTTHSEQYIFDAFRAARKADPTSTIYLNEHSIETKNDKSDAVFDLLTRLRAETVEVNVDGRTLRMPLVDGIGFQAHMLGGENQQPRVEDMRSNMDRFAKLGLEIRLTELDVRVPVVHGVVSEPDSQRQARVFSLMMNLCVEQPSCTGATLWGFTDRRSWISDYPETFSGYGAATPLTEFYTAKPAWYALHAVREK